MAHRDYGICGTGKDGGASGISMYSNVFSGRGSCVCVLADGRGVGQHVARIVKPLPLQGLGVPV